MKLIVGLGNPGDEYKLTRHNIGFIMIDSILKNKNINQSKEKFGGQYFEYTQENNKVIFLKPQKNINLSGEVIKRYVDYFKIEKEDLIIIHDDLDLECGIFKLRETGGSAGHNGLKNIEMHLGTKDYKRIKIGVSNNKTIDTKNYVLGKLSIDELKKINDIAEIMTVLFDDYLVLSFTNLMNKYNK